MPGEKLEDGIGAARELQTQGIGSILTCLGENVSQTAEAESVRDQYIQAQAQIRAQGLATTVSVKLTQLGLDLDKEFCYANLQKIIEASAPTSTLWIDMEDSSYVDATLNIYRRARAAYPNVGICLQAYLRRTADDLASLLPLGPTIRLVKGAYSEPAERAFPHKTDVDKNLFALTQQLLSESSVRAGARVAVATHDITLIQRTKEFVSSLGLPKTALEFQMLYGIQRPEQKRLAEEGWHPVVLVSYGSYWFPWFMRRLAERPANLLFLVQNLWSH